MREALLLRFVVIGLVTCRAAHFPYVADLYDTIKIHKYRFGFIVQGLEFDV